MTSDDITLIENTLKYTFKNKQLLLAAFTHSSYARQYGISDNERLEFLGDAILDMIVSEYLCGRFAACSVGRLSTMRSKVVSADGLRPIVQNLGIMRYLHVADGASDIKKISRKIESNLYEAIVAAIYLDGGFNAVKDFVLNTLSHSLDSVTAFEQKDSKTLLQEYCQKKKLSAPKYVLADRSGSDDKPLFKIDLYIDGNYACSGQGSSKKTAEQYAAKKIVTEWRID